MKCPNCQTEAGDAAFCADCGTALRGSRCTRCDAPLPPGARFCTQCGETLRGSASNLPWYIAGAAIIALVAVILVPVLTRGRGGGADSTTLGANGAPFLSPTSDPAAGGGSTPAGLGAPGPLTGTPREQADRLFNRIMTAMQSGDQQQAQFFMPMAITAYENVPNLDADGLYHLSVLQTAAGDAAAALSTARKILASSPDHLLGLAAAAQAADKTGDTAAAVRYYRHFLDSYDAEKAKSLPEYTEHTQVLPEYRTDAEAYLKSHG